MPNSESVVLDWWTTGDNWSMYKGGKTVSGKISVQKKEQTWKMLSKKIADAGITVARNAKSVGAKLARMEADYKKAYDFVSNTGQGLMEEGKDITEYVKKLCPFYYVLDPVMASRASTKPLAMFDSAEGDEDESEATNEDDDAAEPDDVNDPDYDLLQDEDLGDITDEFISNEVIALDEEDTRQQQGAKIQSKKKKRPLSLVDESPVKKKTKIHPAVEILGNLSSAVTEAAAKKAEAKTKELAERKEIATAEAKLKEREINILERKVELEVRKSTIECDMLDIQQKEQLLLTRKRLADAGVSIDEINAILPLKK